MKVSSPIIMAYPGPPRRASGLVRYLILAIIVVSALFFFRHAAHDGALGQYLDHSPPSATNSPDSPHKPPIPVDHGPKDPSAGKGPADAPVEKPVDKPAEKPVDEADKKPTETPAENIGEKMGESTMEQGPTEKPITPPSTSTHPIDTLIKDAEKTAEDILKKESHDIESAAAEYRKRRGRHPPPGFDKWFEFAQERNAVMVEDFFDQIYHDLNPFWGLPASRLRRDSWEHDITINIRNGNATTGSNWFWTEIWLNMIKTFEHLLPDMDLPLNAMDEPRILAPWEEVNQLMEKEKASRSLAPVKEVVSDWQKLPLPGEGDADLDKREKDWEEVCKSYKDLCALFANCSDPFWKIVTRACPPDSLARKAAVRTDFTNTPFISLEHTKAHTYEGYVSNFTKSVDICHQPDLQALHGMMIFPLSVRSTKVFAPMFGGSKLAVNNEILLPAPMYWSDEERFTGGGQKGVAWKDKQNKVVWRGVATGGRNKAENWRGFQRHRFVAMTNGTQLSGVESWELVPENFAMPSTQWNLGAQQENRLGKWVDEWSDTGFVDLMCTPVEKKGLCSYTSPYYKIASGIKMGDQFDRKYLPDIDGNSFSGRYRGFLMSTSLPIKATIFKEWHDSRLIAWKHFVPMDNRFQDFYGIMQYFVGYKGEKITIPSHDKEAEKLALDGQAWAEKVLRKEDMQIYTLRLLLEFARLSDDRRDKMGWVKDLHKGFW
jgi:hypothetical protein